MGTSEQRACAPGLWSLSSWRSWTLNSHTTWDNSLACPGKLNSPDFSRIQCFHRRNLQRRGRFWGKRLLYGNSNIALLQGAVSRYLGRRWARQTVSLQISPMKSVRTSVLDFCFPVLTQSLDSREAAGIQWKQYHAWCRKDMPLASCVIWGHWHCLSEPCLWDPIWLIKKITMNKASEEFYQVQSPVQMSGVITRQHVRVIPFSALWWPGSNISVRIGPKIFWFVWQSFWVCLQVRYSDCQGSESILYIRSDPCPSFLWYLASSLQHAC